MDETTQYIEMMKIFELFSVYTHALDHTEPLDFANCFTPDGVLGYGDHAIRGREKLREHAETHRAIPTRHIYTSPLYRIADDALSAKGQSTIVVTLATRRGYKIFFSGHFEDELSKLDGNWLLARRWAVDSHLPNEPDFSVGPADPDVAQLLQHVYDSFNRLGDTN
jgi:hypothetical protein